MRKRALLLAVGLCLAPFAANAQSDSKGKVKVTVTVEVDLDELTTLSEVPNTLEAARNAGSTETEIHKGYGAMKVIFIKAKPSMQIAEHFKNQAVEGYSDEGLGDLIKECVDKGLKDEALVKCVLGKAQKKKVDKDHPIVKAIPKDMTKPLVPPPALTKPDVPPPVKLDKPADHETTPTGATKGKKLGGAIKVVK